MKKTYKMIELDCAHCAAKMEASIAKLPGVKSVSISFLTQRMTLETEMDDQSATVAAAAKLVKKIDGDCTLDVNSGK